mmetsp:Transcript_102942/g.174409  ORF Transcript_102942/g.174409 Transcript_102942/m.174409 type:complete len:225 (-) Transcript_102942:809-1483(-)
MVQQFTSAGNIRRRLRKTSPWGDMQRDTWMLALTNRRNRAYIDTLVTGRPSATQMGFIFDIISSRSGASNRLGTSPLFRIPATSSKNDSFTIWVSVNKNTVCFSSTPQPRRIRFRSSFHCVVPYPLMISTCSTLYSQMKAANRLRDWRPDPPTPKLRMWPPGFRMTRAMRAVCSMASMNMTSPIFFDVLSLYSSKYCTITCCIAEKSLTSSYRRTSAPGCMKSP